MQTRQLGNSDMHLTVIGLGTWALGGGDWQFGWGPQEDQDSIQTIHHALEQGINWIDTAAVYGLGTSETVIGQALKQTNYHPYIFTKCSRTWDEQGKIGHSLKRDSLRREVEESLRRLQIDVIDLYQIHWPEPDSDLEEGWSTLAELQKEGKVRYIGLSNATVSQMERALAIAPITSLQPPYSAIRPEIEQKILPFCHKHQIGIIAYSPMQAGLLTGSMSAERVANLPANDWRRQNLQFQEPQLSRNLQIAQLFTEIGRNHNVGTAVVALAWVLRQDTVTGAIVGARHPEQIDGFIAAGDFRLSAEEVAQIDRFLTDHP
jgi:aryl-alcohol dehydrogenase-like predicted oxidoreductase